MDCYYSTKCLVGRGGDSLKTAATFLNVGLNVALITNYSGNLRRMEEFLTIWYKNPPPKNKKRERLFSRVIVENSANDFPSLKIVYGVTECGGCKLSHSVCKLKMDAPKSLYQTLRVALMVVVF